MGSKKEHPNIFFGIRAGGSFAKEMLVGPLLRHSAAEAIGLILVRAR
jgi:hypothetical protein